MMFFFVQNFSKCFHVKHFVLPCNIFTSDLMTYLPSESLIYLLLDCNHVMFGMRIHQDFFSLNNEVIFALHLHENKM